MFLLMALNFTVIALLKYLFQVYVTLPVSQDILVC